MKDLSETYRMRNGVTFADGFLAGGLACGIKKDGKSDLAIIASTTPASAWALLTTNRVKGAPVLVTRANLRSKITRAIVVTSGNANTVTRDGIEHARSMTEAVGRALECRASQVLTAATGVIGQPLPIDKVLRGIPELAPRLTATGGSEVSEAILTTDTSPKQAQASLTIGGRRVRIGGCAKGAGMIHPSMATLLAFVTTDAAIAKPVVRDLLTRANELSFHRITIDGDTSTSDTLVLMANGASGAPEISKPSGPAYTAFLEKLTGVCQNLAKQVVADGEGATKFITVRVTGAASEKQAGRIAMAIGKSSLVKTAIFGEDANWGRILCAAGYAGVPLSVERLKLRIGGQLIFHNGRLAEDRWEEKVAPKLKLRDITIHLDLGDGNESAEVWTCDLSYDYVKINAHYRT